MAFRARVSGLPSLLALLACALGLAVLSAPPALGAWVNSTALKSGQPFIFLHIPKAGGTSITQAFVQKWQRECARYSPGRGSPSKPGARCQWAHVHVSPGNDERAEFVKDALAGKITPPVRYMAAHQPFGFCAFMEQGCRYVTVLREPVDRVLSHYHYLNKRHPGYLDTRCDDCSTIDGFAQELAKGRVRAYGLANMQTRLLAGDGFWSTLSASKLCKLKMAGCDVANQVTEAMLEKAKQNLRDHFAVVGVLEDLDSFGSKLGLSKFGHANKGYSYSTTLAPKTQANLEKSQEYDLDLYRTVLRMIENE